MNNFTEPVCILKTRLFREHDISLSILSQNYGFVTAYAFGGAKSRRRFVGCLDAFTIALCTVQRSAKKGYLTLQEASLISSAKELLPHHIQYGMAKNCALFLQSSCRQEGYYTKGVYTLFYDLLQLFSQGHSLVSNIPIFFRLAIASILGYKPQTHACILCSRHIDNIATPFFSIEKGGLLCSSCNYSSAFKIQTRESLYLLEYITSFSPLYWGSIPYSRHSIQEASILIDEYIQYHLGISWSNGRFIHI